ncbi:MAG: phosphoribosylformylglycinamidine cyclo-ligase [Caldilineaceae bacterium]
MTESLYRKAGVDIDAGNRAVALMKEAVRATHTPAVLTDVGSFGGLFALDAVAEWPTSPVLVASTDGVGTKVKLASEHGRWESIGHDIVNHCVNDILVQGARPLFFLDYLATSRLVPEHAAAVVTGMAQACQAVGCALLGGETAEMPGVYVEGAFDVAGTIVGVVARGAILPNLSAMQAGNLLVGLPSSGPHSNGYSLIRRVVAGRDLSAPAPGDDSGATLLDALLAPHRAYLDVVTRLRRSDVPLLGMAHITGGGLYENLPRVLPDGLRAEVDPRGMAPPPLFETLVGWANMSRAEAYRVFNMGIGLVLILPNAPHLLAQVQALEPGAALLGRLIAGERGVTILGVDERHGAGR